MALTNNANKMVAMIIGGILVLVGILGFVPALTPEGQLLGIFGVNALHNWIHLLTGIVLLGAAFAADGAYARPTNMTLGAVYGLVTVLNLVAAGFMDALINSGPTPLNADTFLHLLLTVVLLGAAFMVRTEERRPIRGTPRA